MKQLYDRDTQFRNTPLENKGLTSHFQGSVELRKDIAIKIFNKAFNGKNRAEINIIPYFASEV